MKSFLRLALALAIAGLIIGCKKPQEQEVPVDAVSLSQQNAELVIGETIQIRATVLPSTATSKTVTWTSSKHSVATVANDGTVTAIAEGQSTITANAGGKFATCQVTVTKGFVAVTSITLNKESMTLVKGAVETMVAIVKPDDATDKTVTWGSSNNGIASVDNNGKVAAVGGGMAVITAKSGNQTATCSVTVTVPVESVSLDREELTLEEEGTATLVATVKPEDATSKNVEWTSSNTQVATVGENGTITAIKEGKTTITARVEDKQATCTVTVQKKFIAVTSITLNKTELALIKGQVETLSATVMPDDATDKTVTWTSSDAAVVTVDTNGKVTAVASGSAIITAKAGELQATCTITVTVPVESVTLDRTSATMEEETTLTLVATVKPDDATKKTVTWSSSNTQAATVDENGKVTAIKEGSATITAKADDKQATCSIKVQKKFVSVTSISLNKSQLALDKGQSETLTATVKPDDATDKTVSWTSSDTAIASVDSNGKVTAVAGGSATITAKAGDKEATCTVSITVPVESISLDKTELALNKGQSETLTAIIKPDDATDKTVTWSSSNSNVAYVDTKGKVTATGGGNATVTATIGKLQATCTVTVTVPVESISLDKTSITLTKGEKTTLTATVSPSNATDKSVSWSSSNENVASVDQNGNVTGHTPGEATIIAKASDQEAKCLVTVIEKDYTGPVVKSLTFSPESIDVSDGPQDVKVTVHVTDESGVNDAKLPNVYFFLQANYDATRQYKRLTMESGTAKDGIYSVTITVPQGKQPGEWTIECYPFYDLYNNSSTSYIHQPTGSKKTITVINN